MDVRNHVKPFHPLVWARCECWVVTFHGSRPILGFSNQFDAETIAMGVYLFSVTALLAREQMPPVQANRTPAGGCFARFLAI